MTTLHNRRRLRLAGSLAALMASATVSIAETAHGPEIERQTWAFSGFRGQFDKAQLQRGFQVYEKVCAACHGLNRVAFRNLVQPGGPEFPEESVKALAAAWPNQITDGPNIEGKMFERPALLSDPIRGPYKNDNEARASQNGALPPDLSLITKARGVERNPSWWAHPFLMLGDIFRSYQEGGADYLRALLTSYPPEVPVYLRDDKGKLNLVQTQNDADKSKYETCVAVAAGEAGAPDTCNKLLDGLYYNTVFPGHQLAMPPPFAGEGAGGVIAYEDGTKPTVENMSADVSAFLSWAADPSHDQRKQMGWQVMLYLLVTTVLLYLGKKRIWSRIKH